MFGVLAVNNFVVELWLHLSKSSSELDFAFGLHKPWLLAVPNVFIWKQTRTE
jgi:hypothetical protein